MPAIISWERRIANNVKRSTGKHASHVFRLTFLRYLQSSDLINRSLHSHLLTAKLFHVKPSVVWHQLALLLNTANNCRCLRCRFTANAAIAGVGTVHMSTGPWAQRARDNA